MFFSIGLRWLYAMPILFKPDLHIHQPNHILWPHQSAPHPTERNQNHSQYLPSSPPRIPSPSPSTSPSPIQSNINPTPLRHRNFIHPTQISNPLTHPRQFLSGITSIQNTRSSFQRNFVKVLAGTCVVACGTAGEETGGVEAFEGALWEGGGCAVGGLGEGGGGEEEDGEEEGEMGEDGHFLLLFFWGWVFGAMMMMMWVEILEWVELFMRWRGCVRDAFPSLCCSEDIYGLRIARILSL